MSDDNKSSLAEQALAGNQIENEIDDFAFLEEDDNVTEEPTSVGGDVTKSFFTMAIDPIKGEDEEEYHATVSLPLLRLPISQLQDLTDVDLISKTNQSALQLGQIYEQYLSSGVQNAQNYLDEKRMMEGDWQQGLVKGERLLRASLSQALLEGKKSSMTGLGAITAMDIVSGVKGYGNLYVHSCGFKLRAKRPHLRDIANLFRRIGTDKRAVGLATGGVGYSADAVYLYEHLLTFLNEHIVSTNIEGYTPSWLPQILTPEGMDEILLGLAGMMHQKGFKYARACVGNLEKCTHVERGILDITECTWFDNSRLTDAHRDHQAKAGRIKLEDVKKYQSDIELLKSEKQVSDNVTVIYKKANMEDIATCGNLWIQGITDSIKKAFAQDPSYNERVGYLNNQMDITAITAYVPYIDKLIMMIDGDEVIVEDMDAIRKTLENQVGTNDELLGKVVQGVLEFQAANQIVVWGTPNYTCPECGKAQVSDNHGAFGTIIPHGVKETFMSLGGRWLSKQSTQ